MQIAGSRIAIRGRLSRMSRRRAVREIAAHGGMVVPRFTSGANYLVVGHAAHSQVESGRLAGELARAARLQVNVVSENSLWRALGLAPALEPVRPFAVSDLERQAGLRSDEIARLSLFDVLEPDGGRYSFRDLVAARAAAALIRQGTTLADLFAALAVVRRSLPRERHPLAQLKLVRDGRGNLLLREGGGVADLSGQMRLALPEPMQPSADTLFDEAELAEASGDLATAASLYRSCIGLAPKDPLPLFNLANVLREQGERAEAEHLFRRALALDPGLADAWYNLADLRDASGDVEAAAACLRKAILADAQFADAYFNLGHLEYHRGAFAAAAQNWERYLALDPNSIWSRRARHGIALCRLRLADPDDRHLASGPMGCEQALPNLWQN